MALDFSRVINQISDMVLHLKSNRQGRQEQINHAVAALHEHDGKLDALRKKIAISKTTWLVAEPTETLDRKYPAGVLPSDFSVVATDGSHIDVDRHHNMPCFLINVSAIILQYGTKPDAVLESEPQVFYKDEDLVIRSPDGLREVAIEGNLLGTKRSVEECRKLAEAMFQTGKGIPAVGLIDGSLLVWSLGGDETPDFVVKALLDDGYLKQLDALRKLCEGQPMAVASYISLPRSNDVVNMLRVAMCPLEKVDSDRCGECKTRDCYKIAGVRDRDLFAQVLHPGERSALFISPSKVQKHYGPHLVHFFYLRLEDEIARVEVPGWVATDKVKLDMVQSLLIDQCQRGQGYPGALSEAHEKAVVTGADRENFWRLVDELTVKEKMQSNDSAKSVSKRTRGI